MRENTPANGPAKRMDPPLAMVPASEEVELEEFHCQPSFFSLYSNYHPRRRWYWRGRIGHALPMLEFGNRYVFQGTALEGSLRHSIIRRNNDFLRRLIAPKDTCIPYKFAYEETVLEQREDAKRLV